MWLSGIFFNSILALWNGQALFATMLVLDNKSSEDCYPAKKNSLTLFQIYPGLIKIEIVPFGLSSQMKNRGKHCPLAPLIDMSDTVHILQDQEQNQPALVRCCRH